jgi:hypothetical protein
MSLNDSFFNEFTLLLPKDAREVRALADKGAWRAFRFGRLFPGDPGLEWTVGAVTETVTTRTSRLCAGAEGGAGMTINAERMAPRNGLRRAATGARTYTGNRALMLEEALIFEIGDGRRTGVDHGAGALLSRTVSAFLERSAPIGLPGLSEPETVRHYTRLSRQNYAIDLGLFPAWVLHDEAQSAPQREGRADARLCRCPPARTAIETVQGALGVIMNWRVAENADRHAAVAMSPRRARMANYVRHAVHPRRAGGAGDARKVILVPESAHGTNPATAAFAAMRSKHPRDGRRARRSCGAEARRLGGPCDVAAVMITNPNTCGLFERDMKAISDAVHAAGGFVYCDGANFNAIVGKVRPGDLGIDAMHINLHKTFSTPHGGGGPGSGRWCCLKRSRPSRRCLSSSRMRMACSLIEEETAAQDGMRSLWPDDGVPWADGHVHPRAGLYPEPRRGWTAAGGRGRGAQRQLCPARWRMCSMRPSEAAAPACTRRCFPMGWRRASRRSTSPKG